MPGVCLPLTTPSGKKKMPSDEDLKEQITFPLDSPWQPRNNGKTIDYPIISFP